MDNTTLHTFLFHCPVALRSLVLLGSWDNFSRPYPLELDARRGRNYWRGCFTFSNIICDGDLDSPAPKRDGPLKMGGTYWYYYMVDGDDECHNPSEPSTTHCPLLPGQRLNVLELPSEGHSCSDSGPSNAFTRNPSDRYLNPVPPAPLRPLPSPHLSNASQQSSPLSLPSQWAPRSATYPPPDTFLSPNVVRHARSASASPHMLSTPLFADFRGLKDKLASKRSSSRTRSSSKPQELEIGSPVLISTTADDLNLIPLPSYRPAPTSAPCNTSSNTNTVTRSLPSIRKEFSPLGSHPVDPIRDAIFHRTDQAMIDGKPLLKRARSHVPSTIVTSEFKLGQSRTRANSADTRRTQHYLFSNDPWLSTPTSQQSFELDAHAPSTENTPPVLTLQRPSVSAAPPGADERPISRHRASPSSNLRQPPLDKELPELPRYLTPAPLFACKDLSPVNLTEETLDEEERVEDEEDEVLSDLITQYQDKPRSHFSTWSSESMMYNHATSDDEATNSPTFSSLASNYSDAGSPPRLSRRYSDIESRSGFGNGLVMLEQHAETQQEEFAAERISVTPPRLGDLHISTFGPDLFNLDIQHADAAPRRQAACYGLGVHYSLPDDIDISGKTTSSETALGIEPNVQRESSLSQLNGLIDDFAYLGDAVV